MGGGGERQEQFAVACVAAEEVSESGCAFHAQESFTAVD